MVWSHHGLTEKYLGEQKLLNFNSCSRHLKIVVINKLRATFVNTRNSWNLSSSWFLVRNTFERNDKFEMYDIWIVLQCKNPFFFNHSQKYFLKSQLFPFYFHDNRHNSILLWGIFFRITYPKHNCKLYKFKVESPLFDYSIKFETCEGMRCAGKCSDVQEHCEGSLILT